MSRDVPLVLARELSEAEQTLRQAGVEMIEVVVTRPPRHAQPQGPLRVVRQRIVERGVQLVAAPSVPLLPPDVAEESDND